VRIRHVTEPVQDSGILTDQASPACECRRTGYVRELRWLEQPKCQAVKVEQTGGE